MIQRVPITVIVMPERSDIDGAAWPAHIEISGGRRLHALEIHFPDGDHRLVTEEEVIKLRKLARDAHACKVNDGCCEDCYADEGECPIERRMKELGASL